MHRSEKYTLYATSFAIFVLVFTMNASISPNLKAVQTANSLSDQIQPEYVIGISFPQKIISAGDIVKVTFSITGKGNFSEGTVLIQSDYEMIMSNTLTIQGVVYPGGQWLNKSGSDIGKQTLVAFGVGAFPFDGLNSIIGRFNLNASGMQPGKYQLRVMLLTENGNGLSTFSDSTEFEVADFYTSHQFELWLFTTVIAVCSLTAPIISRLYAKLTRTSAKTSTKPRSS